MSSVSENVADRLSRLPEEILSQILSLMPTQYAVQTSVLSKRWRYSWMNVTKLDFEDIHTMDSLHSLTEVVDRVLRFCTPSQVKLFRLHFPVICARTSRVSNWIDELVRLKISELDLQVHQLQLPPSMFTCKSLTKLRLEPSGYDYQNVWEFKCPVYLPCLKTLEMFIFSNAHVNAFKLIAGCPVLESLSLDVRVRKGDEGDYVFNIPTLKRLTFESFKCGSWTHKVVLRVPNLEYLCVESLCSLFVMEDVSSLVEVSVSLRGMPSIDPWVVLLKGLTGVKSFSVQGLSFLSDLNSFTSSLPIFPNMKHLVLHDIEHPEQVLQFLQNTPDLEQLSIEAYLYHEKTEEYDWVEPQVAPACMTTSLTTIKFSICKWTKCDIPLLKYMVANAEVLKTATITVTWENMGSEREKFLFEEEIKLHPKAASFCEIHFHEI